MHATSREKHRSEVIVIEDNEVLPHDKAAKKDDNVITIDDPEMSETARGEVSTSAQGVGIQAADGLEPRGAYSNPSSEYYSPSKLEDDLCSLISTDLRACRRRCLLFRYQQCTAPTGGTKLTSPSFVIAKFKPPNEGISGIPFEA